MLTDVNYLRNVQYRDAGNLQAWAGLHLRFGTNSVRWMDWYFQQLDVPTFGRLLEVGCGPGWLWKENAERIPPGWNITLTDLSPAMIEVARSSLAEVDRDFTFAEADVQEIPFPDESYDAVLANHMLFHIRDIDLGLSEIRRVLKPGGKLFVAAHGRDHFHELRELAPELRPGSFADRFGLENGYDKLRPYFAEISMQRFENTLVITEAQALYTAIRSSNMAIGVERSVLAEIQWRIENQMRRNGEIRITPRDGLFTANRRPA